MWKIVRQVGYLQAFVGSWLIPQLPIPLRHDTYCQIIMYSDGILCRLLSPCMYQCSPLYQFTACTTELWQNVTYSIYLNARQGFSLKFGVQMRKVILNSHFKHWIGSLWTGPCGAKPRPASPVVMCRQKREQSLSKANWHYLLFWTLSIC